MLNLESIVECYVELVKFAMVEFCVPIGTGKEAALTSLGNYLVIGPLPIDSVP